MTPAAAILPLRALSDGQIELLAEQIDLGKCVLVLGPWARMTPEGLPVPAALAQALGAELAQPIAEPNNLAMAATAFQKQNEGGRLILERLVANFLRNQTVPGELLDAVVQLPFRILLTTGQDNLLQHAFASAGKPYQEGYYRMNQTQPDAFDETSSRPFIYQLFGKVDPVKGSDSLILTQQDQMDYLDSVQGVGKETRLPPALRKAMQDAKCFLFLGFDYENWYLRVLLHVLRLSEKAELVFGLPIGQPGSELSASAGAFFSAQYKFSFYAETALDLLRKLRSKLASADANAAQPATKTRQLLYLNAPEDAALVGEIDRSLSLLKEQFGLVARSINDLLPGADIELSRQQAVDEANLLLPILSADFVAVDWLVDTLTTRALTRHGSPGVRVVAIYARDVLGAAELFQGKASILPAEDIPLSDMNREKALLKIGLELEKILRAL